jgi:predicted XRE-type DNA-binding protein
MKNYRHEVKCGSGKVYCDLGHENADTKQLKALLAAEIIRALYRDRLTVRQAQAMTGFAAANFSRIRNVNLGRFTLDRLMSILNHLGSRVDVRVRIKLANRGTHVATA